MDINIDYIGQKYLGCFLVDINTSYVWLGKTKGGIKQTNNSIKN
jgi:hypothetical protein